MNATLQVFRALQTFDRPATRAEIERESGLDYDTVHSALRTLRNHGLLIKHVDAPRHRGLYELVEDARKPETARGRYERTEVHRQQLGVSARIRRASGYSPAMPPSHAAAPGALRTVIKGVLDVRRYQHSELAHDDVCALAKLWRRERT